VGALTEGPRVDSVSGDLVTFYCLVESDETVLQGTTKFTYILLLLGIQLFPFGFQDQIIKEL